MYTGFDLQYLLSFLARLVFFAFAGSLAANIMLELGVAERVARLVSPLLKLARLPGALSAPMVALLLEPRVGHAMIASLLEREVVEEREVVAATLVVAPLATLTFAVPRFYLPVVFPALGATLAITYLCFALSCSLARMAVGAAYGRSAPRRERTGDVVAYEPPRTRESGVLKRALRESLALTRRIATRSALVVALLALASYVGIFSWLEEGLENLVGLVGLPTCAAAIAATYAVSPTAGTALAGVLLAQAGVTPKEALLGLLLGAALFRAASEYPRHTFPFYASIYPTRIALKLTGIVVAIDLPVLAISLFAVWTLL